MPCSYTFGAEYQCTDIKKNIQNGDSILNLRHAPLPLKLSPTVAHQTLSKSHSIPSLVRCTAAVALVGIIAFKNWSHYGHPY